MRNVLTGLMGGLFLACGLAQADVPAIVGLNVSESNNTVTVSGSFADADPGDEHAVVVEWGDGRSSHLALAVGDRVFSVDHRYLDCTLSYTLGVTLSDRPLMIGNVGLWNFDADTADDLSVHGNHGTAGAAVTFSNDVAATIGGGKSIVGGGGGGTTGIVVVPSSTSLESMVDQVTVAFWIKADHIANPDWVRMIRKGNEGGGTNSWMVTRHINNDDTLIRTDTTGAGSAFNQNRGIGVGLGVMDGTWHHLAYTLDNGDWREYVDGGLSGSGTYPHGDGFSTTHDLQFLGRTGQGVIGHMDEVALWNRALSDAEILTVASGALPDLPHSDVWSTNLLVSCPVTLTNLTLSLIPSVCRQVQVDGAFEDLQTNDRHRVLIEWGDGQIEVIDVALGGRSFSTNHQYAAVGTYAVSATVYDRPEMAGVVGTWTFDAADAFDYSGNGNHGDVGATLSFSTNIPAATGSGRSVVGQGVTGNPGLVRVPTSPSTESIQHALSVAFWIKAEATNNADWVRIVRKGSEADGTNSWLIDRFTNSDETNIRVDTAGPGGQFNQNLADGVGPNVLDDTWHHLVYTLNNGTWNEYVDGALAGTGPYDHGVGLGNAQPILFIGRGTPNVVGQMDDLAVWNRALTSTDVVAVASSAVPLAPYSHSSSSAIDVRCIELVLDKSVSLTNFWTGTNLVYTLAITNSSTLTAGGVVVTDSLPATVIFLSSVPPADLTNGNDYVYNFGMLAPGTFTSIVIRVGVTTNASGILTNWASLSTTNVEDNLTNNIDWALTVIPDSDGDGLANPFDPDDDNDAFDDVAEAIANTDPLDPTSFLQVWISKGGSDLVRDLRFNTSTGRVYTLQRATNFFVGPWVDVRTNFPGTGLPYLTRDTNGFDRMFYRISVEAP